MSSESYDFNQIMETRREAVASNIRPISAPELKALGEKLFPYLDDSWRGVYFSFLEENPGGTFFYASTQDDIHVVYNRDKNKGLWFIPGAGKGPLQERGLKILKEIVDHL